MNAYLGWCVLLAAVIALTASLIDWNKFKAEVDRWTDRIWR